MKRAISYRRVSSGSQVKGHGLQRQEDIIKEYCSKMDLLLVDDLVDDGLSAFKGHHKDKGEFGAFLVALKQGTIQCDCLLVENFDRIGRMPVMEQFSQFSVLIQTGIELHIISENRIFTKENINLNPYELFGVLAQMARSYDESRIKAERIKKAFNKKMQDVEKGIIFSKTCPFWLDVSDNAFVINSKVDICCTVFNYALKGYGANRIAQILNDEKVQLPSNTGNQFWTRNKVQRILSNKAVIGHFIGKNTSTYNETYYPAVIKSDDFYKVQSLIKTRDKSKSKSKKDYVNIFSSLLYCSCGSKMKTFKIGDDFLTKRTIKCRNASELKMCPANNDITYHLKPFEIQSLELIYDLALSSIKAQTPVQNYNQNEEKIKILTEQNNNLVTLIMKGNVSDAIVQKSIELEAEIKRLKSIPETVIEEVHIDNDEYERIAVKTLYDEDNETRLLVQSRMHSVINKIIFSENGVLYVLKNGCQYFLRPFSQRDFTPIYSLRIPEDALELLDMLPKRRINIDTSKRRK